jgi:hypothetical protein
MWESPIYQMKNCKNETIQIDVTSSCAPNLGPNKVIFDIVKYFKDHDVEKIIDFGAGVFRHTKPFVDAHFNVWAVEFEKQYETPMSLLKRQEIENNPNFYLLMFPDQFLRSKNKYDAAILAFVLPTMPKPNERKKLLEYLRDCLKSKSYIFWMSQYGKYSEVQKDENKVGDGWYLQPKRKFHSFYTEFKNKDIDDLMASIGYEMIKYLGTSGHDQFRLYAKGGLKWATITTKK